MKKTRTFSILALVILASALLFGNSTTQATPADVGEVILIDFHDMHTNPTGNWNTIGTLARNTTVSNLIDFNTSAATTISYTGNGWTASTNHEENWEGGNKAWVVDDAGDDGFSNHGGISTITLGGLAGSSYTVELVVSAHWDDVADYTIGGSFADRNFNGTGGVNGDNFDALADGRDPRNWLIWDNVTPSEENIIITFDSTGTGGTYADANALRLREISVGTDPATMGENSTPASSSGLSITNNTFRQDTGDVIDFFHNNATDNVTTDLGATGVVQRWARTWECDVTDVNSNGGTVDLTFDFAAAGMNSADPPAGAASNYKLLHRTGTSGDFSLLTTGTPVVNTAGWTVTFPGVDSTLLCSQITLGTTDAGNSPTAVSLQSITATNNTAIIPVLIATLLLLLAVGVALRRRA